MSTSHQPGVFTSLRAAHESSSEPSNWSSNDPGLGKALLHGGEVLLQGGGVLLHRGGVLINHTFI